MRSALWIDVGNYTLSNERSKAEHSIPRREKKISTVPCRDKHQKRFFRLAAAKIATADVAKTAVATLAAAEEVFSILCFIQYTV